MENRPPLVCTDGFEARELRKKLGLNQTDFWARVGVEQSGGSRYEKGRHIPEQVLWALHLVYGTEDQASALVAWLQA